MATSDQHDPFQWDIDAVCKHLCAAGSPWTSNNEALEKQIRSEEIDGETLLTTEFTMSRQELMEFLDLRTAKHKSKMALEVKRLRAASDGFKEWKKENGHFLSEAIQQKEEEKKGVLPDSSTSADREPSPQPHKRRRIMPTLLDTSGSSTQNKTLTNGNFDVPDPHLAPDSEVGPSTPAVSSPLPPKELPLNSDDSQDSHNFSLRSDQNMSGSRRRAMYQKTLSAMRKHRNRQDLMGRGEVARESPDSQSPSEELEEDEVKNLDDMDLDWDEQTLREVAEEEEDQLSRQQQKDDASRPLDPDDVRQILEQVKVDMKVKWNSAKRLKAEHIARRAWDRARSSPACEKATEKAQHDCRFFETQLARSCDEIVKQMWTKEADVRKQADMLETTVGNCMKSSLLLATLSRRDRPPTPPPMPMSQPKPRRKEVDEADDISVGSSDEEDFVVQDADEETNVQVGQDEPKMTDIVVLDEDHDIIDLVTPTVTNHHEDNGIHVNDTQEKNPMNAPRKKFVLCPSLSNPDDFSKAASEKPMVWVKKRDRWRLVISLLSRLRHAERGEIFETCQNLDSNAVWEATVEYVLSRSSKKKWKGTNDDEDRIPLNFTCIFWSFWRCQIFRPSRIKALPNKSKDKASTVKDNLFKQYVDFLPRLKSGFPSSDLVLDFSEILGGLEDIEMNEEERKQAKKTGKEVIQDAKAKEMREKGHQRAKELEDKKLKLRAQLGQTGVMPLDKSKIIINESKREDQAVIYINEFIGCRIKMHQVNGVRFLWNQIVTEADQGQGCLLSHTMGLGKTMQAITLLVTIQECARSKNASISSQIPQDLRASRTIILCPAGLIKNWIDEIQQWDKGGVLAPITKVDPQILPSMRRSFLCNWSRRGGTLIMGYELFVGLESDSTPEIRDILTRQPNLVVVDEAHNLKNQRSLKSIACSSFLTKRRVALTGSPLANNVEEYYSMIEWVAPGFLGPIEEFKTFFAGPIHNGLWTTSSNRERRKALSLLEALTQIVAPKVNRASMNDFKKDLPEKLEFVISVVPTAMQRKLYSIYVDGLLADLSGTEKVPQAKVFGALSLLGLICNHPQCFREKTLNVANAKALTDGEVEFKCYPYSIIPQVLKETQSIGDRDRGLSGKVDAVRMILDDARSKHEKTLLFSQSIQTLHFLKRLFNNENRSCSLLDGNTPTAKRQQEVAEFNNGPTQVYLISTTAGGVGLNIQSATRVIIFDQKWNPAHEQQAIARAYRMGQKKRVVVYRLITAGTFEDDLQNNAIFKQQLASRVIDKRTPSSWSKQLLGTFVHHIHDNTTEDLTGFLGKDKALDKIIADSMLHSSVQRVLSADTFEEEDPTDELTEEEKKHADKIAELGRERLTQPDKFNGRMNLLLLKYHDLQFSADNSAALKELEMLTAPQTGLEENEAEASPMSPDARAARPDWMQTYPGASKLYKAKDAEEQAVKQGHALQPILGANTFFSGAADSPRLPSATTTTETVDSNNHEPGPQAQAASHQTTWARLTSKSSLNQSSVSNKDAFERAIMATFDQAKHLLSPDEINSAHNSIKSVTSEIAKIRTEQNFGFIYNNRRWKTLTDMVRQNERLVLAIALRIIQPSYLATSDERVLEGKVVAITAMSPEKFEEEFIRGRRTETPKVSDRAQQCTHHHCNMSS